MSSDSDEENDVPPVPKGGSKSKVFFNDTPGRRKSLTKKKNKSKCK